VRKSLVVLARHGAKAVLVARRGDHEDWHSAGLSAWNIVNPRVSQSGTSTAPQQSRSAPASGRGAPSRARAAANDVAPVREGGLSALQKKGGLCRTEACLAENSFGGGGASGGWDLPPQQRHTYHNPWTPPARADVPPAWRPPTKSELLSALDRVLIETLRALDAARGAKAGVDAFSASGREVVKNDLTRAGRAYQKHMGRGELPRVPGRDLNSAGQNLLDEILMNPRTKQIVVSSGNFSGGTRFIGPNGIGATFDAKGVFQYFGVYP
jgi:hypothetical protein